jgi:hypothetical protein
MQSVCYNCGLPVAASQAFCGSCGARLHVEGLDTPTQVIDESSPRQSSRGSSLPDDTLMYSLPGGTPFVDPSAPIMEYSPYTKTSPAPSEEYIPFWPEDPEREAPPQSFSNQARPPAAAAARPAYPPATNNRHSVHPSAYSQQKTNAPGSTAAGKKIITRRKALGTLAGLSVLAAAGFGASLVFSSKKEAGAVAGKVASKREPVTHSAQLKATLTYTYSGHQSPVHGIVWKPMLQPGHDPLRVASSAANVQLWDALNGGNVKTYNHYQGEVLSLAWCHSTYKIVSGNLDGTAQLWVASTQQYVNNLVGHTAPIRGVAWARDGGHIATASSDTRVGLWVLNAQQSDAARPNFLTGHTNVVNTVSFSDDSRYLVSGAADNMAMLWQVQGGSYLASYSGHNGAVRTVAFAPGASQSSGLLIASGGADATVQVWTWSLANSAFRLVAQYTGHTTAINALTWSPDGSRIASADSSGQVHIWRSGSGEKLLAFQAHQGAANALAWSPGGQYLASAGQDRVVHVYKIS